MSARSRALFETSRGWSLAFVRLICFLLLILTFVFWPRNAAAVVNGDLGQMRLVAAAYRSNIECIRTWQGNAKIVDYPGDPAKFASIGTAIADFAYDARRSAVRWNFNVLKPGQSTKLNEDDFLVTSSQMTQNNEHYKLGPNWRTKSRRRSTLVTAPKNERPKGLRDEFHPMFFFRCIRPDMPKFLEVMCSYYENPHETSGRTVEIRRDGHRITLHMARQKNYNDFVFDLSQSGLLVAYDSASLGRTESWTFTYEHLDNAYVPKSVKFRNLPDLKAEGDEKSQRGFARDVVFEQQSVNQPVPESEFSLERMGVRVGDTVNDRLRNIDYKFGQPPTAPAVVVNGASGSRAWILITLNLGVFVLIVAIIYYRKSRQRSVTAT